MTFHYFISVSEIHIDGLCLVFLFTEFRFAVLLCLSFSLPCLIGHAYSWLCSGLGPGWYTASSLAGPSNQDHQQVNNGDGRALSSHWTCNTSEMTEDWVVVGVRGEANHLTSWILVSATLYFIPTLLLAKWFVTVWSSVSSVQHSSKYAMKTSKRKKSMPWEFGYLIFSSAGVYKTAELWQVKEPLPLPAPKKRNCSMVFTLKEMEEATGMFSDKNLIGKGGFGRVYRGVLKDGQVRSTSEDVVVLSLGTVFRLLSMGRVWTLRKQIRPSISEDCGVFVI